MISADKQQYAMKYFFKKKKSQNHVQLPKTFLRPLTCHKPQTAFDVRRETFSRSLSHMFSSLSESIRAFSDRVLRHPFLSGDCPDFVSGLKEKICKWSETITLFYADLSYTMLLWFHCLFVSLFIPLHLPTVHYSQCKSTFYHWYTVALSR